MQHDPQFTASIPMNATQEIAADGVMPIVSDGWSFRGYRMRSGEFNAAIIHLYRAEITRANTWRNRLDVTTNWALVATSAAITFAFGDQSAHHSVIILSTLMTTLFLFIEARRYRYYELWSYRIRLIETDYFAAMLVPPFGPDPTWAKQLSDSLLNPQFPITMWEAFGRRFRRNYMWIYLVLGLAWIAKIILYPEVITGIPDLFNRASMGVIPGWLVLLVGLGFNGALFVIGVLTWTLRQATGEILPGYVAKDDGEVSGDVATKQGTETDSPSSTIDMEEV